MLSSTSSFALTTRTTTTKIRIQSSIVSFQQQQQKLKRNQHNTLLFFDNTIKTNNNNYHNEQIITKINNNNQQGYCINKSCLFSISSNINDGNNQYSNLFCNVSKKIRNILLFISLYRSTSYQRIVLSFKQKVRRLFVMTYMIVMMGCTSTIFLSIPPSYASSSSISSTTTSSSATSTTRPISSKDSSSTTTQLSWMDNMLQKTSPSIDTLIDRYVQRYMFDDDTNNIDPIESLFREVNDDIKTGGKYPKAIQDIADSILYPQSTVSSVPTSAAITKGNLLLSKVRNMFTNIKSMNIGTILISTISILQNKFGLSETVSIMILASVFVIAGPSIFLFMGMIIGGISKRNMNQLMKKRYGDTYTVDATIKQEEPEVTAPSDDDDEDDEDDNDDDDDDDNDDEDNTKNSSKDKKKGKK